MMLERVWNEVRKQGVATPETLARRLGLTPELVRLALDLMARRGLLEPTPLVERPCGVCPLSAACMRFRVRPGGARATAGVHASGAAGCQSGCSW